METAAEREERMKEKIELEAKVDRSAHKLSRILTLSSERFRGDAEKNKKWWDLLEVDEPTSQHVVKRLKTLHELFQTHDFLEREGSAFARRLAFDGRCICTVCYKKSQVAGLFLANATSAKQHANDGAHKKNMALHDATVRRIDAIAAGVGGGGGGSEGEGRVLALLVGKFVAGGHGAAGIPPSSLPAYLPQPILSLLQELKGGLPVKSTILGSTLEAAVQLVKDRLKTLVKDIKVSLYVDGGKNHMAYGRKVMVVCASSLEWEFDVLLDVQILEGHETGESIADQIEALCKEYSISKLDVWYVCADNASVNPAAVDELNKRGFKVTFARCLPHCANLVVQAFMDPLETAFAYGSNLKKLRGLLNAGGSSKRKLMAIEYALSTSRIDFAETRWASEVQAIRYVANKQRKSDLKLARRRLEELRDGGDPLAADALEEYDRELVVFNVIYDFVDTIAEDELKKIVRKGDKEVVLGDKDLLKSRRELLTYFSSTTNFLAFQLVDIVLGGSKDEKVDSLVTVMHIAQGSAKYSCEMESRKSGEVPTAAGAARGLMSMLGNMVLPKKATPVQKANVEAKLEAVRKELEKRAVTQMKAVIELARECKEHLHLAEEARKEVGAEEEEEGAEEEEEGAEKEEEEWSEAKFKVEVERFTLQETARRKSHVDAVMAGLTAACKAVRDAHGLKKMEECVGGLEVSQHFDTNKKPGVGGEEHTDVAILAHLGVPDHPLDERDHLIAGWRAYVKHWVKPPQTLPPPAVFEFWKEYSQRDTPGLAALGRLAMMSFSRPVSSACCERIFSYLEHMDASDRQTTGKATLQRLLFLRGNWRLLTQMTEEEYARRVDTQAQSRKRQRAVEEETGEARVRAAQAAAAAAATAAAAAADKEDEGQNDR